MGSCGPLAHPLYASALALEGEGYPGNYAVSRRTVVTLVTAPVRGAIVAAGCCEMWHSWGLLVNRGWAEGWLLLNGMWPIFPVAFGTVMASLRHCISLVCFFLLSRRRLV